MNHIRGLVKPLDSCFRTFEVGSTTTGTYLTTLAATDWTADTISKPNFATVGAYFMINLPAVSIPCFTIQATALIAPRTFWKPFLIAVPPFWKPFLIALPVV